jgi:hypothetical protein
MIKNDLDLFDTVLKIKEYIYLNKYIISIIIIIVLIIQCIIIALIIGLIGFICFIFFSYYVYNFFKINTTNCFFFKDYNEDIKSILDKYGDLKIKNIYILRQRLPTFIFKFINIVSFYKYSDMFIPDHTSLIFEIKSKGLNNGLNKFLKLEKNNYININENYNINRTQDIKYIRFNRKKSKGVTLNQILDKTRERVTDEKFFNWHIFTNNCQQFTKELLITLKQYTKSNEQYVFQDKKLLIKEFTDFHYYATNCIFNVYNLLQPLLQSLILSRI